MRILLIDPSDRGGIAAYSDVVARALTAAGADVTLLGSEALAGASRPYELRPLLPLQPWGRPEGAGPRFYAERLRAWISGARAVRRVVARERPDVVHWQFGLNRRLDALLLRRLDREIAQVWTAHDVLPFERTSADEARFARIYRAVDGVIVHNAPAAAEVSTLAGVDAVEIAHPAPDVTPMSRADARARLGWGAGERTFVAAGYVRPYKGYGLLAEVWGRLGAAAPRLVVVGEPWSSAEAALLDRLDALPRVTVTRAFVPDEDLHALVRAADALVLPYEESSDSGLVHLARAAGTPVLASDAPQLAATVRATGAGLVLPREVNAWARAVTGPLPPPPPPPPGGEVVARAHLAVYRSVLEARSTPSGDDRSGTRLLVYTDSDVVGGAERSLATLLSCLDGRYSVTIAGVHPQVLDELRSSRPDSATLLLPRVRNKWDVAAIAAHVRAFRRSGADLFHANLRIPWSCQYGVLAAALVRDLPLIAVEHAPVPPSGGVQLRLRRLLVARYAAHVAVSDGAAREIERVFALASGTVTTIYNGVPDREVPRARPRERVTVGAAGRLVPEKRIDLLLEAAARVPGVDVLVSGTGPQRRDLESLAVRLGIDARVRFADVKGDVRGWVADVDLCAVTSDIEAFSLVAAEAMLAEIPVVATRVGGLPEVVLDGETGVIVPPGEVGALADAIAKLAGDTEERRRLGRNGRKRALTEFTPERMARRFEELYSAVSEGS